MKRKWILFVCLLGIVFMASPSRMEAAEKELKMGLIAPLSGAGAPWGLCWEKTLLLQAEQYNAAGGIQVGGEKYKIKIITGDDKYIASEAVNVANKLIFKDEVKFIFGPIGSACVLAITPITEANKILAMVNSYTSKALGPDKPFTFGADRTMGETLPPMIKYVQKNYPNIRKVGLVGPNDESGWSILLEYRANAEKIGYEIVAEDYFERNTSDFYPVLTRILSKKPDVLMIDASTGDLGLLLKQARQIGFKGLTLTSNPHDPEKLCKVSGKEGAEGHIHSSSFITPGGLQKWHDTFVARWKAFDPISINFVNYTEWLIQGIKKADSLDTEKVRVGIETVNFVSSLYGPLKAGGKNRYGIAHRLLGPIPISQIKGCTNVGLELFPGEEPLPAPAMKK
jgi:branched-chain amino acid transport system substrate-binding protein